MRSSSPKWVVHIKSCEWVCTIKSYHRWSAKLATPRRTSPNQPLDAECAGHIGPHSMAACRTLADLHVIMWLYHDGNLSWLALSPGPGSSPRGAPPGNPLEKRAGDLKFFIKVSGRSSRLKSTPVQRMNPRKKNKKRLFTWQAWIRISCSPLRGGIGLRTASALLSQPDRINRTPTSEDGMCFLCLYLFDGANVINCFCCAERASYFH